MGNLEEDLQPQDPNKPKKASAIENLENLGNLGDALKNFVRPGNLVTPASGLINSFLEHNQDDQSHPPQQGVRYLTGNPGSFQQSARPEPPFIPSMVKIIKNNSKGSPTGKGSAGTE